MALSKIGWFAVKGTRGIAKKIAETTGCSKQAVHLWIKNNHENLTRATVLDIIISETGFTREQLLEETIAEQPQERN